MHLPAQSREFCWRNWVPIRAFRRIHHRQHNRVRRIFNRRLAEQEAACYGENCRVESDSQSQRENYGGSKSWILAQHAQAIAKVLDEAFDEVKAAGVAAFFLGTLKAAKLDARAPQRFFARHTAANQIFGECLDVEAQLRIHLAFHPGSSQDGQQPKSEASPESHFSSLMSQCH